MLYTFPPGAEARNWLHSSVVELVRAGLEARIAGENPPAWPEAILPAARAALSGRPGLRQRYEDACHAFQALTIEQTQDVLSFIDSKLNYGDVLAGEILHQLICPDNARTAIGALFQFGFELLKAVKSNPAAERVIRDEIYADAYCAMPGHFCPFCGIDRFDAPHPDLPRHPLDHYLPISLYPFFGVYLRNLVPMCARCNSSFKLAADMLRDELGGARPCADPYGDRCATISLVRSRPFQGEDGEVPDWEIDFVPDDPIFHTWDAVFRIRLRYRESLLNAEYRAWLGEFAKWVIDSSLQIDDRESARNALSRFANLCSPLGDQGFLKRPMFEMLAEAVLRKGADGVRLVAFIRALCTQ